MNDMAGIVSRDRGFSRALRDDSGISGFFQITGNFHGNELRTQSGTDKLDNLRFRDFLRGG